MVIVVLFGDTVDFGGIEKIVVVSVILCVQLASSASLHTSGASKVSLLSALASLALSSERPSSTFRNSLRKRTVYTVVQGTPSLRQQAAAAAWTRCCRAFVTMDGSDRERRSGGREDQYLDDIRPTAAQALKGQAPDPPQCDALHAEVIICHCEATDRYEAMYHKIGGEAPGDQYAVLAKRRISGWGESEYGGGTPPGGERKELENRRWNHKDIGGQRAAFGRCTWDSKQGGNVQYQLAKGARCQ